MDWTRAIEEEREALGRIVLLLHALAVLAERAAGRSPLVRGLVLWLLRQAEAVARDFVGAGHDVPSASMPIVPAGAGPEDAVRLAISLRALARQLDGQARLLSVACGRIGREPAAPRPARKPASRDALPAWLMRLAAFAAGAPHPALAPDTS